MSKALIIVDVQNDFVEGGSLAVPGGRAVAARLGEWLEDVHLNYNLIIASKDWHIDPGNHWSDNPDYVDSWPRHCEADTYGSRFVGEWYWAYDYVVHKGEYEAAYSAFDGSWGGRPLAEILEDTQEVDVVGIAYDYCVKATALDSARFGYKTRILTDLTVPVHSDEASLFGLELELRTAGVELALSGLDSED